MIAADTTTAVTDDDQLYPVCILHRDAQDAVVYWAGYTNGHDGQGWTAERKEALEFELFSAAGREFKAAKRCHPTMKITLERVP